MSRLDKVEIGIFIALWIGLMVTFGDQVWDSIAWENKFIHSLGTIVLTAVGTAVMTTILFGIYWFFRSLWRGSGRLLVIPWLLVSKLLYPAFLAKDWPATNPDPKGTAASFALMSAALIMFVSLWLGSILLDLRARKGGRDSLLARRPRRIPLPPRQVRRATASPPQQPRV